MLRATYCIIHIILFNSQKVKQDKANPDKTKQIKQIKTNIKQIQKHINNINNKTFSMRSSSPQTDITI